MAEQPATGLAAHLQRLAGQSLIYGLGPVLYQIFFERLVFSRFEKRWIEPLCAEFLERNCWWVGE